MNGAKRIAQERMRQIKEEGWTAEHDGAHDCGELAAAAAVYAAGANNIGANSIYEEQRLARANGSETIRFQPLWPFSNTWHKLSGYCRQVDASCRDETLYGRVRDLEKAGALCAAEIDRLLRILEDRGVKTS